MKSLILLMFLFVSCDYLPYLSLPDPEPVEEEVIQEATQEDINKALEFIGSPEWEEYFKGFNTESGKI